MDTGRGNPEKLQWPPRCEEVESNTYLGRLMSLEVVRSRLGKKGVELLMKEYRVSVTEKGKF